MVSAPKQRLSLGLDRRSFMGGVFAATLPMASTPASSTSNIFAKPIPSTGEMLPALGLGSWITFNVGEDIELRDECAAVMEGFFESGGRLIDSSPMYGSSQEVIGYGLEKLGRSRDLFSADKVWTGSVSGASPQIEESRLLWNIRRFDLLQVHNLVAWQDHLPMLFDMKQEGKLRFVGITTSEGRRHSEFEQIMRSQPIDFVQFTYNIVDREAEDRLLPLAQERRMAVIANRPFQQGVLLEKLQAYPLPAWAAVYVAAGFAFEAVALFVMAFLGRVPLKPIHGVEAKCGQILFLCALFGYPLLPYLTGRDWRQAEFFGLAPDPTAIGTLGLLLIARGGIRLALMLLPFLWCVITALTLHELGAAYGWIVHVVTLSIGVVFGQIGEFNQV